jgi:hypothetical protein
VRQKFGVLGLLLASLVGLAGSSPVYAQSWNNRGYNQGWSDGRGQYRDDHYDRNRRDYDRRYRHEYERQQRAWRERQRWEQRRWNSQQFRGYGYSGQYRGYYGIPY